MVDEPGNHERAAELSLLLFGTTVYAEVVRDALADVAVVVASEALCEDPAVSEIDR